MIWSIHELGCIQEDEISKCVVFNACQWCWDGHMTWIDMEFMTPMEGASTCSQQMFTICVPLAVTAGRRYRDIKWYKEKEPERWSMLWWVCCRLVPIHKHIYKSWVSLALARTSYMFPTAGNQKAKAATEATPIAPEAFVGVTHAYPVWPAPCQNCYDVSWGKWWYSVSQT